MWLLLVTTAGPSDARLATGASCFLAGWGLTKMGQPANRSCADSRGRMHAGYNPTLELRATMWWSLDFLKQNARAWQ
jgi:hypothetical protein